MSFDNARKWASILASYHNLNTTIADNTRGKWCVIMHWTGTDGKEYQRIVRSIKAAREYMNPW